MKAMVASLFLMFLILLTQFNSFYQTFLTLSTVVMSVMGVSAGHDADRPEVLDHHDRELGSWPSPGSW